MSKNVYADIGLPDSDEMMVKAGLVSEIERIMAEQKLTQLSVSQATGIIPGRVSTMRRGQFHDISIERLIDALRLLGCDVDIVVHKTGKQGESGKLAMMSAV